VYKSALEVRLKYFGGKNLAVALAHEDLAYATYVFEYSSGKFQVYKLLAYRQFFVIPLPSHPPPIRTRY
jgi:hypothetical protein